MVDDVNAAYGSGDPQVRITELEQRVAALQQALQECREIGVAVGVLVSHDAVSEDDAYELLAIASRRIGQPMREVARIVRTTGALPLTY